MRFKPWMQDFLVDLLRNGDWEAIVRRLGGRAALAASARRFGAFQRARGVASAEDLLRLALAYGPGGRSLRVTAAEAAACGIADVSDVALLGRFQRSGKWLTWLCRQLLGGMEDRPDAAPEDLPAEGIEPLIEILDGSRIEGPGKSCWRLHLSYDVSRQRIADFAVTPLAQGEKLDRVALRPGRLLIADRGYPQPNALRAAREAGAHVLVRLTWNSLHLLDKAEEPLDWMALFAKAAQNGQVDMPVTVRKPRGRFEPLPLRLVILPKPPEAADSARKACRRAARKDQRRADPRTLEAAGYLILITSLETEAFPPQLLATLYRIRWQIELAIKRLKSILHLDRLPAKDPDLAQTWITAHLLIALLIDDTAAELAESSPSGTSNEPPAIDLAPNLLDRLSPPSRHLASA